MSGRIITTILEKGQGFPRIGPPPTFWPFMVLGLGTVMAPAGMPFTMLTLITMLITLLITC